MRSTSGTTARLRPVWDEQGSHRLGAEGVRPVAEAVDRGPERREVREPSVPDADRPVGGQEPGVRREAGDVTGRDEDVRVALHPDEARALTRCRLGWDRTCRP